MQYNIVQQIGKLQHVHVCIRGDDDIDNKNCKNTHSGKSKLDVHSVHKIWWGTKKLAV